MSIKTTRLGKNGPLVSRVGLGLWQAGMGLWGRADREEIIRGIRKAQDLGINLFDTAEVYGRGSSERILGSALGDSGAVVVSKLAGYRVTFRGMEKASRAIAGRLGRRPTVLLHHWPPPFHSSVCAVSRRLKMLINEGITKFVGVSNYPLDLLQVAWKCSAGSIQAIQIQYNLAFRLPEKTILGFAKDWGIGVMAWSPLAKGALAGKRAADNRARKSDPVFAAASSDYGLLSTLERVSDELGVTTAEVSLAWIVSKGAIPIVGFRRVEHVEQAAEAADLELPAWAIEELDGASRRYVDLWGDEYRLFSRLRYIPSPFQALALKILGGV